MKARLDQSVRRTQRFLREGQQQRVMLQAREFSRIYAEELEVSQRNSLEALLACQNSLGRAMAYAFFGDAFRQISLDTIIMKFLILCRRL